MADTTTELGEGDGRTKEEIIENILKLQDELSGTFFLFQDINFHWFNLIFCMHRFKKGTGQVGA